MLDLRTIADRGGLVGRRRGLGPCPACGAETRSRRDRRPPVVVYVRDGEEHWHCKSAGCGAGGGVGALLSAIRFRQVLPKGDPRWAEVMQELDGGRALPSAPRPVPTPLPAPTYPPVGEVSTLWDACLPIGSSVATVDRYLHTRGVDTRRLAMLDLSRALFEDAVFPRWVPTGGVDTRVWTGVYGLVTPMFDPLGRMRSLRFRAIEPTPDGKKTLNPRGHTYAGLVMADPMGQALLRGRREDDGIAWDGRVVVVEGEPDFWTWSCHPQRLATDRTWAVLGVVSGSWTDAIARRIPDGARVILRTHHDKPGDAYAERIRASLAARCDVLRSTPPPPAHAEAP